MPPRQRSSRRPDCRACRGRSWRKIGLVEMIGDDDLDLAAQHLAAEILRRHFGGHLAAGPGDVGVEPDMSRIPPSFSGGLVCASDAVEMAAVAAMDSHKPRTLERIRFMEVSLERAASACGLTSVRRSCRKRCAAASRGKPVPFRVFPLSGMSGCRAHDVVLSSAIMISFHQHRASILLCSLALLVAAGPAIGAGCAFEAQGEGRVAAVIDARTFRLEDGREVRLAGIEPVYFRKTRRLTSGPRFGTGRDRRAATRSRWPVRTTPPTVRPSACLRVSRSLRHIGAEPVAGAGRRAGFGHRDQ